MKRVVIPVLCCTCIAAWVAIGNAEDGQPKRVVVKKKYGPNLLPPIVFDSTDADVNRDGSVDGKDLKLAQDGQDLQAIEFMKSFKAKVVAARDNYQPRGQGFDHEWAMGEPKAEKNLPSLAQAMIEFFIPVDSDTPAPKAGMVIFWGGGPDPGQFLSDSVISGIAPADRDSARAGKLWCIFDADQSGRMHPRWKIVRAPDVSLAVPLTADVN